MDMLLAAMTSKVNYTNQLSATDEDDYTADASSVDGSAAGAVPLTMDDIINVDKFKVRQPKTNHNLPRLMHKIDTHTPPLLIDTHTLS